MASQSPEQTGEFLLLLKWPQDILYFSVSHKEAIHSGLASSLPSHKNPGGCITYVPIANLCCRKKPKN